MIYTEEILLILQIAYVERKKMYIIFYLFANYFLMQGIPYLMNYSKYKI